MALTLACEICDHAEHEPGVCSHYWSIPYSTVLFCQCGVPGGVIRIDKQPVDKSGG